MPCSTIRRCKEASSGVEKLNEHLAKEETTEAHEPLVISEKNLNIAYDVKRPLQKR